MNNTALLHIRTSVEDKEKAALILNNLGTNLSAVVNMMIKQIILTRRIPFDISLDAKSKAKATSAVNEVNASMQMEDFNLDENDLSILSSCAEGIISSDDARSSIIKALKK